MIRRFALASAVLIAAASATPAMAGTETSDLNVSATVSPSCTISTNPLAFGSYDPIGTNATTALDVTGSLTTTCGNGSQSIVTLSQGSNANVTSTDDVPRRRLSDGNNNFLPYEIFREQTMQTIWGNTPNSSVVVTGTGQQVNTPIYARIPPGQSVPSGNYIDTVVATIDF